MWGPGPESNECRRPVVSTMNVSPPRNAKTCPYPPARPGMAARFTASGRSPASRVWRDTNTRGTPGSSSEATSDWMPWAPPRSFMPTAGRQHTTVGDTTVGEPRPGMSMTTATLPSSPESHCSLCPSKVNPGPLTANVEQRSGSILGLGAGVMPASV